MSHIFLRPTLLCFTLALATIAVACGGSPSKSVEADATTTSAPTTVLPTTTTVHPGTLPQTEEKPPATSTLFDTHMKALADAIITNGPTKGLSSFFPVDAYKQTKKNTDPAADWKNRLIANFNVDVTNANKLLGPNAASAVFQGIDVPNTAIWVKPGEEYNVGPYWRVFKAQMVFSVDKKTIRVPIESMISWRGQWYVVHLGKIR